MCMQRQHAIVVATCCVWKENIKKQTQIVCGSTGRIPIGRMGGGGKGVGPYGKCGKGVSVGQDLLEKRK